MTEREFLRKWWNDAWQTGLWAAAWSKSVDGLTAQQAAWAPHRDRHSIWQIVLHMVFWREDSLHQLATGQKPTEEAVRELNYPVIKEVSEAGWGDARRRLAESQERVSAVLADDAQSIERVMFLIPHDCYHMGQINYLRALQGLKAID
jgi:uncharacterized damage-inducible protein DinB